MSCFHVSNITLNAVATALNGDGQTLVEALTTANVNAVAECYNEPPEDASITFEATTVPPLELAKRASCLLYNSNPEGPLLGSLNNLIESLKSQGFHSNHPAWDSSPAWD